MMRKVKIINIDKYLYTLEDTNKKTYKKNIEFLDTEINVGDYIYISDEVLDEENIYTYGQIMKETSPDDLIKIVKDDKEIYLQRYYG